MNLKKATEKLAGMREKDPSGDYCITMEWGGKYKVGVKTDAQKKVDDSDPELADTSIADFVENYDITTDLH